MGGFFAPLGRGLYIIPKFLHKAYKVIFFY